LISIAAYIAIVGFGVIIHYKVFYTLVAPWLGIYLLTIVTFTVSHFWLQLTWLDYINNHHWLWIIFAILVNLLLLTFGSDNGNGAIRSVGIGDFQIFVPFWGMIFIIIFLIQLVKQPVLKWEKLIAIFILMFVYIYLLMMMPSFYFVFLVLLLLCGFSLISQDKLRWLIGFSIMLLFLSIIFYHLNSYSYVSYRLYASWLFANYYPQYAGYDLVNLHNVFLQAGYFGLDDNHKIDLTNQHNPLVLLSALRGNLMSGFIVSLLVFFSYLVYQNIKFISKERQILMYSLLLLFSANNIFAIGSLLGVVPLVQSLGIPFIAPNDAGLLGLILILGSIFWRDKVLEK
jgi:cell division protein FtsW (lipid II flippase)